MICLTRCYRFSASHRLHLASLSDAQNDALYGKCNNPFGHGHNYRLEVSVSGPVHQQTGQLLPAGRLDQLVEEKVLALLDHRYINLDVVDFRSLVPTTENLLLFIGRLLEQHWEDYIPGPARLYRLHIQETDRNTFEELYSASAAVTT